MAKKYIVRLSQEERSELVALISKGRASAQKIKHANVLLKVDAAGPDCSDEQAGEPAGRCNCSASAWWSWRSWSPSRRRR